MWIFETAFQIIYLKMNDADILDRQYRSNERDLPDRYTASRKSANGLAIKTIIDADHEDFLEKAKRRHSVRRENFLNPRYEEGDVEEEFEEYESNDELDDIDYIYPLSPVKNKVVKIDKNPNGDHDSKPLNVSLKLF